MPPTSPDGRRIVSSSEDRTVRVWEVAGGHEMLILKGHSDIVRGVAFGGDGNKIVSGGWDRTVRVWDATPPEEELADPIGKEQGK